MSENNKAITKATTTDNITYPRTISNIVYVRRKKRDSLPTTGDIVMDESIEKIGSSFKGNASLRGLTFEEEKVFLREIIGVSPDSPNWESACTEYWKNISKEVPASDKDGEGGLKLETGMIYATKEAYEKDLNARKENGAVIMPAGRPINLADYILWRYCLVYGDVANDIKDVGKSPKIRFYLFSKAKQIEEEKVGFEVRKKAAQLLYSQINDREWVEHILRVLIQQDAAPTYTIKDLPTLGEGEKDVILEKYMKQNPVLFHALGQDKDLQMRSFVELAIAMNILTRVPNTSTVNYETETLGTDMVQVIAYLKNPSNDETYKRIKAQVAVKPS